MGVISKKRWCSHCNEAVRKDIGFLDTQSYSYLQSKSTMPKFKNVFGLVRPVSLHGIAIVLCDMLYVGFHCGTAAVAFCRIAAAMPSRNVDRISKAKANRYIVVHRYQLAEELTRSRKHSPRMFWFDFNAPASNVTASPR
jgi:hypothetical protein